MARTVRVELGDRSYDVLIAPGALAQLGQAVAGAGKVSSVAVVSDSNVAGLYGKAALDSLAAAGIGCSLLTFPAGEAHKTLATYAHLVDELFAVRPAIDRDCLVVALGGGVAGDMAGFLAATALRGLRWLQCPTTLLAAVDASVGGKTGLDHPAGKNLIGAFHQPRGVIIDVRTLRTLPRQELLSGLAECVKHAVIRDAALLDFIEEKAQAILSVDEQVMAELVGMNVAIKAAVVSADEREAGERAHLNFGHTVGHAIETLVGYGAMTHGQAVALGMIAACAVAEQKGLVDGSLRRRLGEVLSRLGLAVQWPGADAGAVWAIMQHDKKVRAGKVRMVLPTGLGKVAVYDDVTPQQVERALSEMACKCPPR